MLQEINNKRAQIAYESVSQVVGNEDFAKEYRSLARSLPAMLQMNGLGATVTYLYAKRGKKDGKDPYSILYNTITDWYKQMKNTKLPSDLKFIEIITYMESDEYRILTREVRDLLIWVKRFAEGMIDSGKTSQ